MSAGIARMPKLRQVFAPETRAAKEVSAACAAVAPQAETAQGVPATEATERGRGATSCEDGEDLVEVSVHLAIHSGQELRVRLPARACFRHVKEALAHCLGDEGLVQRVSLMARENDGYNIFRDRDYIRNVRSLLVVNAEFGAHAGEVVVYRPPAAELEPLSLSRPVAALKDDDRISRLGGASKAGDDASSSTVATAGAGSARTAGEDSDEDASDLPRGPLEPKKRVPTGTGFVGGVKNKNINKQQAYALQKELHEGFSTLAFQKRLQRLREQEGITHTEFLRLRQDLMLEVQSEILPKYGFEGTPAGVYKMFGAMAPFIKDKEFKRTAEEINALIGLDSPADTWKNLTKTCYTIKFRDTTCDPLDSGEGDGAPSPAGAGTLSDGRLAKRSGLLARAAEVVERRGQPAVGKVYECSDGGRWREVTIVTKSPDGTFVVKVHDEEEHTVWENVALERIRPVQHGPDSPEAQQAALEAADEVARLAPRSEPDAAALSRTYHIAGSWDDWKDLHDFYKTGVDGSHMTEVKIPAGTDVQFQICSDGNWANKFFPAREGDEDICGPFNGGNTVWRAGVADIPSKLVVCWNPTGGRCVTFDLSAR